jgi:hypothetical protein
MCGNSGFDRFLYRKPDEGLASRATPLSPEIFSRPFSNDGAGVLLSLRPGGVSVLGSAGGLGSGVDDTLEAPFLLASCMIANSLPEIE